MTRRSYVRKFVELLGAGLVVALLFGAVPSASARDHRADCRARIEKAEFKLDQSIRAHGPYSRQAQNRRRQLRAERERCWNREHAWWDGRGQSWHNDRDWDRDDHDRDRDHH